MQLGSYTLDANLYVFAIVGGFLLMAFLFGEARLKRIALAILAGLLAADQLTEFVITQAQPILRLNDPTVVRFGLLILVAIPLSLGKLVSVGGRFSIRSFGLALLTSATLIAYTHSYLTGGMLDQLSTDYNLVAIAVDHQYYWLSGLLLWLIILQLWKKRSKDDDDKKGKKKR